MDNKIKVGITHGDPNGIGYETILRMMEDARMAELATIVIYGSAKVMAFYRKALELANAPVQKINSAAEAVAGSFNIINVIPEDYKIEPGTPTAAAGEAAVAALEAAVSDLTAGDIDVLVTCPIDKMTAQSDNFRYPGHTEFLEARLVDNDANPEDSRSLMILSSGNLRVALATAHMPLSAVPAAITEELIMDKLRRFDRSLRRDYAIHHPRIAVLALNPHAGEEGLLGSEEKDVIIPAIEQARRENIQAFGPYAADGFFGAGHHKHFDGILAMYHDQGLAPFKALAMDSGINFTAGLPYVRTSPAHGTGFDIAGKGLANESSLREAVYAAIDIFRNRRREDAATMRPLRKQYYDRGKGGDPTITLED